VVRIVQVAKAFVADICVFFAEPNAIKRDEVSYMLCNPSQRMSNMGFCNGPWFVNPSFHFTRYPFAGVVLLYGVGAQAAT